MFVKHGDGKIIHVLDEEELTDDQKSSLEDLSDKQKSKIKKNNSSNTKNSGS